MSDDSARPKLAIGPQLAAYVVKLERERRIWKTVALIQAGLAVAQFLLTSC